MFKKFDYRQFGKLGIKVYLSISISSFSIAYFLIRQNFISKDFVFGHLERRGYNPSHYIEKYGENKINLALAYVILFSTKPIRIVLSFILSGYIVNRNKQVIPSTSLSSSTSSASAINKKISLLKKFGPLGLIIYTIYWISTGLILYILLKRKYIDTDSIIKKTSNNETIHKYYNKIEKKIGSNNKDIAVAYLLNAVLEIIRLPTFLYFFRKFTKK
jgi:hypothetical protein